MKHVERIFDEFLLGVGGRAAVGGVRAPAQVAVEEGEEVGEDVVDGDADAEGDAQVDWWGVEMRAIGGV